MYKKALSLLIVGNLVVLMCYICVMELSGARVLPQAAGQLQLELEELEEKAKQEEANSTSGSNSNGTDVGVGDGGTDANGSGNNQGGNQQEGSGNNNSIGSSGDKEYVGDKYYTGPGIWDEYLGYGNGYYYGIGSKDNIFGDFRGQSEPSFDCPGKSMAGDLDGAKWDPYYGGWVYTGADGSRNVIFPSGDGAGHV